MKNMTIKCLLLLSIFCVVASFGQSDDNRKKKKKKDAACCTTGDHKGHDHSKGDHSGHNHASHEGHGHSHDGGHGHSHDGAAHSGHTEQKVCPVMGSEINKDSKMYVDHNGHRIYYCCEACRDELAANFDTYLQKLEEMGQHAEEVE